MAAKLNVKKKKADELPTMAVPEVCWLTGPEGRERWKEVEIELEAKKQKKADVAAQKEQAELNKQRRRKEIVSGNKEVTFSGSLTSRRLTNCTTSPSHFV